MSKKQKDPFEVVLLKTALNRSKSLWSFSNIRTWDGILIEAYGKQKEDVPSDLINKPISFKELQLIFDQEYEKYKSKLEPSKEIQVEVVSKEGMEVPLPTTTKLITQPAKDRPSPYNPKPKKQVCDLLPKQIEAAKHIFDSLVLDHKYGMQLIGATGVGKTFVMGNVFLNLFEVGFFYGKSVSPWPIVCITKASIVEKTKRELKRWFNIDCDIDEVKVINIDQLRATFGEMYIKEETIVVQGEAHIQYTWKPNIHPSLFWWDENQVLKNDYSQQSRIGQAVNDIWVKYPKGAAVYQVFASATPFTRVAEGKCFAVATRKKVRIGSGEQIISNSLWPTVAKTIANPADPYEYSPSAMERFVEEFDDYIYTMKNVRSKYHARNSIQMISFRNSEEESFYEKAMERYLKKKGELEDEGASFMCVLVELLKFRQAAEYIRSEYIADWMHECYTRDHMSPVGAVCFKETINRICWFLHKKYNYSREDISIIWGGNVSGGVNKETSRKASQAEAILKNEELMRQFESEGIDLALLGLDLSETEKKVVHKSAEEIDFIKSFNLGPQNPKQRQKEIDRFQYGKSKFCIFTFKAGGVGLSLHHEFQATHQRTTIVTPTYSAMELVQGLGRCPRITSLSDTPQTLVFYRGTIEEHVAARVSAKLKCLQKAVRQRESWEDVILGEKYKKPILELKEGETDDEEDEALEGTFIEEDENGNGSNEVKK